MVSNSTFVRQLYQTALARDPDTGGASYWSGELDRGFYTPAMVAYNFFASAEYQQGVETVSRLYYAAFKRAPDVPGVQFWMNISRQGATLDQIATQFVASAEFKAVNGVVAGNGSLVDILYANVLGRVADAAGRADWVNALNGGASTGSVLAGFSNSLEFQQKANSLVTNALAYHAIAGRAPTSAELAATPGDLTSIVLGAVSKSSGSSISTTTGLSYSALAFSESSANDGSIGTSVTVSLGGDTFVGSIGAKLGKVSGVPTGLTASLTKTTDTTATLTLTGNAKTHGASSSTSGLSVAFSATDFTSASTTGKAGLTQAMSVSFVELPAYESGGDLFVSGVVTTSVRVDLLADKLYFGTGLGVLSSGAMSNVKNVDATGITGTKVTVTLIGDDAVNTLTASDLGGSITGGKGADILVSGAGVDRFVFSSVAADNGVDILNGFALGATGDVLDFSAFLNKTGTTHIAPVSSASVADAVWASGDVLIATGYSLDTAAEIAALFNAGASAPYAAPTAASKMVVISADIVGDASIWYVVNQTGVTTIDSSEVTLVGTLTGIHNLGLSGFGFATANFG